MAPHWLNLLNDSSIYYILVKSVLASLTKFLFYERSHHVFCKRALGGRDHSKNDIMVHETLAKHEASTISFYEPNDVILEWA